MAKYALFVSNYFAFAFCLYLFGVLTFRADGSKILFYHNLVSVSTIIHVPTIKRFNTFTVCYVWY